jgi:hypothetical protein
MDKSTVFLIERLQMELSDLAMQYRSSEKYSEAHHQALYGYYKTFQQVVKLNGGIFALDPDAELPDELMPKEYVDYWLNGGK